MYPKKMSFLYSDILLNLEICGQTVVKPLSVFLQASIHQCLNYPINQSDLSSKRILDRRNMNEGDTLFLFIFVFKLDLEE